MAYNEGLAEKLDRILAEKKVAYTAKKMFGGLCYLVDEKMCFGIVQDKFMARINPDIYLSSLEKERVNEMNFTGRPMKGYVFVQSEIWDIDDNLEYWIQLCLDYNPLAKASKKKKIN